MSLISFHVNSDCFLQFSHDEHGYGAFHDFSCSCNLSVAVGRPKPKTSASKPFEVSKISNLLVTEPVPFSFEKRDKETLERREERLKKVKLHSWRVEHVFENVTGMLLRRSLVSCTARLVRAPGNPQMLPQWNFHCHSIVFVTSRYSLFFVLEYSGVVILTAFSRPCSRSCYSPKSYDIYILL